MILNEGNHISNHLGDFLVYLKSLVYKINQSRLEESINVNVINYGKTSNTIFSVEDRYIWLRTDEFRQWINLIEKFNFKDATEIIVNYVAGVVHPILDKNRMIENSIDGYILYVKCKY